MRLARGVALGAVLASGMACEFLYDPSHLHPNLVGPDGGALQDGGGVDGGGAGTDAGSDAGGQQFRDAGRLCFGPFDAGCAVLCIEDLTGSFGGAASLAAAKGPAAGFEVSSIAFALNRDAWVGIASASGVTITNTVSANSRIDYLGVVEGHYLPGTQTQCAEALLTYGSLAEFFTSGYGNDSCANRVLSAASGGQPSLAWLPSSGTSKGDVSVGTGINTVHLFESAFPFASLTGSQPISSAAPISDVIGLPAFSEWMVVYSDETADRWPDTWQSEAGTPYTLSTSPSAGAVEAATGAGRGVIAGFSPPGTLSLTLMLPDYTVYTIAGPTGITNPTSLHITKWGTLNGGTQQDAGTDIFRTTYVARGQVAYWDWNVTNTAPGIGNGGALADACAPPDVTWAAAIEPNMLLTIRSDGGVALTPMQ